MNYENLVIVLHLVITALLIGAVLIQRSEGGALGIGGGGGGGMMSGRSAATAIQKATWGLAAAFIVTSLTLAVLSSGTDGVDLTTTAPSAEPGQTESGGGAGETPLGDTPFTAPGSESEDGFVLPDFGDDASAPATAPETETDAAPETTPEAPTEGDGAAAPAETSIAAVDLGPLPFAPTLKPFEKGVDR